MKRYFLIFLMMPALAWAHGGDDHGAAAKTNVSPTSYFTSEAFSDKYEALIKYGHADAGTEAVLKLFISNFNTNQALHPEKLEVTVAGHPAIKISVSEIEKGMYELKGIFPDTAHYNLLININGPLGADLLQVNDIEPSQVLPAVADVVAHSHWYQSNWFYGILGLLAGLLIMFFVMKNKSQKLRAVMIFLYCLLPAKGIYNVSAHEGHNEAGASKGSVSNIFLVEKETQFLFNIITEKIGSGDFNESSVLLGTVIAAPQGKAVIQSPQTGKIVSLKVSPGQHVNKGQVMAVVEQQMDAGTQISIISQQNTVNAEYDAAKAQYERLKAIEDIAAKKDVTEAKARYESAKRNKELFENNSENNASSTKLITLTSPISGVVGTFNYAIGAVVSAGETLFEETNLDQVFVEAQMFSSDALKLKSAISITATSNSDTSIYKLLLVSTAQSVNAGNQSQQVIFQIVNPKGQFKIGENVNVRMTGNEVTRQVILPNDAITEVNGKPVVFIKDKAEQYSISFIVKGQSNDKMTIISKGVEDGERVVTTNVYQMKMMYLNQ